MFRIMNMVGDMEMDRRRFLFGFGAAAVCTGGPLRGYAAESVAAAAGLQTIVIRYGFSVMNTSDAVVGQSQVSVCAPASVSATQRCSSVLAPRATRIGKDALGNQTATFSVDRLAPRAVALLRVQAELLVGRVDEKSDAGPGAFLEPDRWVQSGHPEIIRLAQSLKQGDQALTAKSLCQWVKEHVKDNGYVRSSLGAVYALETGKGDCTESAVLFTALCRAAGIPARVCGGFLVKGSGVLGPSQHHNWAEFHDGKAWSLADPNLGRFCEKEEQYVAVQIWSGGLVKTGLVNTDCSAFDVQMLG